MAFTIGELARRAGMRASAIRYWERVGVLPAPARIGGRRLYTRDALGALQMVHLGKQAGFTLAELRQLLACTGSRPQSRRAMLRAKREEVRELRSDLARMDRLLRKALTCRCRDLRACLAKRLPDNEGTSRASYLG